MSNVTLCFGDKQKRARIPNSFKELDTIIREKFPDIPEGKIEIKATVADGNTYPIIENDKDLEDVGRDGIEALVIKSQSPKFTGTVDEIPKPGSPIVKKILEEINQDGCNIDLKQMFTELRKGVDLLQLTAIAANKPGAGLQFLEKGAYDLIVFMTELSHDADAFYTKCRIECSSVTSSVMKAVALLLDGLDEDGLKKLASLGGTSRLLGETCHELVTKVEAGMEKMSQIETMLGEVVKSYEEREHLQTGIEKQDLTTASLNKDFQDFTVGATQRREKSDQIADLITKATTVTVAGLFTTGTQALPLVLTLLTATGGLLLGLNRQVSDTNVQQKEDEQALALIRREEDEAKAKLLDLTRKLEELNAVDVKHALECLHLVKGHLNKLRSTLIQWKQLWEKISALFLQSQQDKEEAFESKKAKHLEGNSSNQIFKEEIINYLASWVAFREHCIKSQTAIKANIEPLLRLVERNPTRDEAEEELRQRARQICTDNSQNAKRP